MASTAMPPQRRGAVRRIGALLAAAGITFGLAAAPSIAGPATPAHAADSKTFTIALTQDVDTLNPFQALFSSTTQMGRLMYDFLTAYDPKDDHPVAGLATKWTTSKDGLTWTYTIRSGAKWTDGQPITARDVAFTYNKMMTDADAAEANGNFTANFAKVTAPSATTVIITTKTPQATMLALDIPIVPEHTWKDVKNYKTFANDKNPVSSGPFQLVQNKPGQYVKFKVNPTYWRGKAKFDTLIFQEFKNSDAAVQALRKGEVDIVSGLTAAQANALKGEKNISLNIAKGKRFYEMSFNSGATTKTGKPIGNGNPALKDKQVRLALATAIDNDAIVKRVIGGYGEVGTGYIPELYSTYHWSPTGSEIRKFDLKRAAQILEDDGYKKGSDGIRTKSGVKLDFKLTLHNDSDEDTKIASYLKGWFKEIGVNVKPQAVSDDQLNSELGKGNFDLVAGGWTVNPDPDYVLAIQTCAARPASASSSGTTDQFFCNKNYDALYAKQLSAASDPAQRANYVKAMQKIIYDEVPGVIMYYPDKMEAYRNDKWGGFDVQPQPGGVILNQDGFWGIYSATPKGLLPSNAPTVGQTATSAASSSSAASGGATTNADNKASGGGSGGSNTGLIVGIVIAVVVVAAVGGLAMSRRRRTADDRE